MLSTKPLPSLQTAVQDYAYRLRQCVPEDWTIKLFRSQYPNRFQELCMVHLSFLIDIPWNLIEQKSNYTQESSTKSALKRFFNGCKINANNIKSDAIPEGMTNNLLKLIDRLDNDEACSVEGIFRKAGHTIRKRQLQDAIIQSSIDTNLIQWDKYSFHDLASALKSILMHLPTPLLTERLIPLFLQVSGLRKFQNNQFNSNHVLHINANNHNHNSMLNNSLNEQQHLNLIESKQIKALRLLIQLLPTTNLLIFKRLMNLLTRVKQFQSNNRMTSACLGTVFGPVLLPQGIIQETITSTLKNLKNPAAECQERCRQLSAMTTVLIETGMNVFLLPRALVEDVYTNSNQTVNHLSSPTTSTSAGISTASVTVTNTTNPANLIPNITAVTSMTLPTVSPNTRLLNTIRHSSSNTEQAKSTLFYKLHPSIQNFGTIKKQSIQFNKENFFNLSPCLIDSHGDSPPLKTGIRFATPTPASAVSCRLCPSPQFISNFSSPKSPKQYYTNRSTDNELPKWNRSADDISPRHLNYTPKNHKIIDSDQVNICESFFDNKMIDTNSQSSHSPYLFTNNQSNEYISALESPHRFGQFQETVSNKFSQYKSPQRYLGLTEFKPQNVNNTYLTTNNHVTVEKIDEIDDDNVDYKRKFRRKRRFTELRLPTSSNHRRNIFSPCPPIPLLPFRKFGNGKRESCSLNVTSPTIEDRISIPSATSL